jgi:hypothetical protein
MVMVYILKGMEKVDVSVKGKTDPGACSRPAHTIG